MTTDDYRFENHVHDITIDGQAVELSLWDTAGMRSGYTW